jgi:hypothetical protein
MAVGIPAGLRPYPGRVLTVGGLSRSERAEYDELGFVRLPGVGDASTCRAMLDRVVEVARRAAAGDRSTGWVLPEANLAGRDEVAGGRTRSGESPRMGASRTWGVAWLAAAAVVGSAGVAFAGVSDGNYRPEEQRCSGHADDVDHPDVAEPGCQSATLHAGDRAGGEAVRVGFAQTPEGEPVDPTSPQVEAGRVDPTTGVHTYFGADDNLDNGEHDSSSAIGDGPSDGGAIVVDVDPAAVATWLEHVAAQDWGWVLAHPLPGAGAGAGACADGVCFSAQTERRLAYDGGADPGTGEPDRDVADYGGHTWDPESCAGPSDGEEDCGPGGIASWHDSYGDAYVEPGVQVYEDPSPEGSPVGPYPIPAAYAGTCGAIAGGGPVHAPASPLTNDAGQLVLTTCP